MKRNICSRAAPVRCLQRPAAQKKTRRNHSGSTTALTSYDTCSDASVFASVSYGDADRCSHQKYPEPLNDIGLVRPHSLQPLQGLSYTHGFKIPRQLSVKPRSMPRRHLPNDKSSAWKCPRSLTLGCAGGVTTCMDEFTP